MMHTFSTSLLRALPSIISSGVMPSVSFASQVRAAFAHISSSVQAGSSFSSRVSTCCEVMWMFTQHAAHDIGLGTGTGPERENALRHFDGQGRRCRRRGRLEGALLEAGESGRGE